MSVSYGLTTTAATWYPPALGTGGFLLDAQLFTNPPFAPMTYSPTTQAALERLRTQPPTSDQYGAGALIDPQLLREVVAAWWEDTFVNDYVIDRQGNYRSAEDCLAELVIRARAAASKQQS